MFFDSNKWEGIGFNLVDEHPIGAIKRKKHAAKQWDRKIRTGWRTIR